MFFRKQMEMKEELELHRKKCDEMERKLNELQQELQESRLKLLESKDNARKESIKKKVFCRNCVHGLTDEYSHIECELDHNRSCPHFERKIGE